MADENLINEAVEQANINQDKIETVKEALRNAGTLASHTNVINALQSTGIPQEQVNSIESYIREEMDSRFN